MELFRTLKLRKFLKEYILIFKGLNILLCILHKDSLEERKNDFKLLSIITRLNFYCVQKFMIKVGKSMVGIYFLCKVKVGGLETCFFLGEEEVVGSIT